MFSLALSFQNRRAACAEVSAPRRLPPSACLRKRARNRPPPSPGCAALRFPADLWLRACVRGAAQLAGRRGAPPASRKPSPAAPRLAAPRGGDPPSPGSPAPTPARLSEGRPRLFRTKMVTIADLPEDILIDVLVRVPARELVRSCRPVCSLWRDLVDLPSLWKRKCQRDGHSPETPDKHVSDWRVYYFLCSLKRNLIRNPCAEEGFHSWQKELNGGDEWKIEELPGAHGQDFPRPHVRKYFVTSYGPCVKSQLITLKKEGYWDQLMDEVKPDIVVKDWYAARFDCGCRYQLCVRLLSADYIVLQEFTPEDVVIEQWSDAEWQEVSYTFHDYPAGVRHILFRHGGQDTQFWAGWYGVRITNTSITIGPEVAG